MSQITLLLLTGKFLIVKTTFLREVETAIRSGVKPQFGDLAQHGDSILGLWFSLTTGKVRQGLSSEKVCRCETSSGICGKAGK